MAEKTKSKSVPVSTFAARGGAAKSHSAETLFAVWAVHSTRVEPLPCLVPLSGTIIISAVG